MKIERLENNKIKVTLSKLDLVDYNISVSALTPNSPVLHSFLYEVMERVKAETGFNPYSGQVVVEATPDEDGIILMVTKLSEQRRKRPKGVKATIKSEQNTYRFVSFDSMCSYFSECDMSSLNGLVLYRYEDDFYLICSNKISPRIKEFAEYVSGNRLNGHFLDEHGEKLCEGEGLQKMAIGIKNM